MAHGISIFTKISMAGKCRSDPHCYSAWMKLLLGTEVENFRLWNRKEELFSVKSFFSLFPQHGRGDFPVGAVWNKSSSSSRYHSFHGCPTGKGSLRLTIDRLVTVGMVILDHCNTCRIHMPSPYSLPYGGADLELHVVPL